MDLTQRVNLYFASIRQRSIDELLTLFAANATMVLPDGRELVGAAAIRQLFTTLFAAQTSPTPTLTVIGDRQAASEVETHLPDGSIRRTANFYHFDEAGLIKRLSHYARSA